MLFQYPLQVIPFRVIGIDPGSNTLGVAVLDIDLMSQTETLVDARTFDASKGLREYHNMLRVYGELATRVQSHEDTLVGYFSFYRPHAIICESPFLGRFPAAFKALLACMFSIQRAVIRYDRFMPLHMADPMSVKAAVGVTSKGIPKGPRQKGRKRGRTNAELAKDKVRDAVLGLDMINASGLDLTLLDEHSIDAIAVARARVMAMFQP